MENALDTEQSGDTKDSVVTIDKTKETSQVKPEEGVPQKQSQSDDCLSSPAVTEESAPKTQTHPLEENVVEPQTHGVSNIPVNESPKKGRRVSFPAPERGVVSGFMDPPNPWQDAEKCSTEDLVNAYTRACDRQGIKPIPKLFNQLQAINDFCDRNETLTLKGEKLDGRHCETLEEVLRRVQFRTLDIENTHLEDEGAVALFDMIEYYESCIKINISFNKNIGLRGWQACARMLKKTPCVENLDARNCALTEQVMPMLGRALRMGSQLTTLHLENAILSGRPLMILVTAIKMNEILRELYLADNKLMPSDGIQLGNMLKFNHKLQLLDIRNNHLQDVGTSHLCDGLYEQNLGSGLNTLVLWNNQITYQSMHSLGRALSSTQCLETINLGHNNITNEGVHRMKEGLIINKSLLRIGLQASKISCEGAVALAEFIADSTRLVRIDLRENDIKTGGLMALSLALKVSETVTRIDLDKDPKKESGIKDYVDQQRRLLQDINNYMIRNRDLIRKREEEEIERQKQEEEEQKRAKEEEQEMKRRMEEEAEAQKEEEEEEAKEEVGEMGEANRMAERFKLKLPLATRTQTLESPAFVRETDMSFSAPPTELEIANQAAAQAAATANQEIPMEFPPSPMAPQPQAKALLGTIVESPDSADNMAAALPSSNSPSQSPTSRRKFVISRVEEKEGAIRWGAHAAAAAAAEGDKSGEAANSQAWKSETSSDKSEASNGSQGISNGATEGEDSRVSNSLSEYVSNIVHNAVDQRHKDLGDQSADGAHGAEDDAKPSNDLREGLEGSEEFTPSIESLENANRRISDSAIGTENIDIRMSENGPSGGDVKKTSKGPDFHTNLSMNGMKTELATVLDSLEHTREQQPFPLLSLPGDSGIANLDAVSEQAHSPDDFERELDAMLAGFSATLSTSNANKSVEEILAEGSNP